MTGLDASLGLVLAFGLWRGLRTGALMQVVGTIGWVLGFVAATALMGPVGEMTATSLGVSPRTAPILGFTVVLGAVLAGLTAAAHVVRKTLQAIKLGALDTAAGGALGALRAAFGLSVLLLATSFTPVPGAGPLFLDEADREASVLYDPIEALAPEVWDVVRSSTPGWQEALADKFHTWREGDPEADTDEDALE